MMLLPTYSNFSEISVFRNFFFLGTFANFGHFFNEKSLVEVEIIFPRSKSDTNLPLKILLIHTQK